MSGLVAFAPPLVHRASLARDDVGLTFVGHATFLIETPQGIRIATDYNDYVYLGAAHHRDDEQGAFHPFSHTRIPRSRTCSGDGIRRGGPVRHDLTVGDVRGATSRPTSGTSAAAPSSTAIRSSCSRRRSCIAHLGHLHHTLSPEHLKKLGRIDVVLVPVDGGYTLETFDMMEVLKAIDAKLMLPMHYFNSTLERFLAAARKHYPVEFSDNPSLTISRATLPRQPMVLVLPGR